MSFWSAEIVGKSFHTITNEEIFAVLREIVGENTDDKPLDPDTIHLVVKAIESGDLVWQMDLKA